MITVPVPIIIPENSGPMTTADWWIVGVTMVVSLGICTWLWLDTYR